MTSRRDALTFLGLVGVASPALSTETLALNQKHGKFPQLAQAVHVKRIAAAMRKLADGLEAGAVIPEGLSISSSLGNYPPGLDEPNSVSLAELKALARGIERESMAHGDQRAFAWAMGKIRQLTSANDAGWLEQELRFRFYLTEAGHDDPIVQTDPLA